MKTWTLLGIAGALALAPITRAQDYSIDWWTVDGGGGTSTGGVYAVSGTVGQPDAGQMSGGNYTVSGGFWSLLAVVETPGAPLLTITRTTTNTVVVSWLSPSTGWNLEQNTNVNTTTWVAPPESVTDNSTEKFIVVNPPAGNRFYRLHKPWCRAASERGGALASWSAVCPEAEPRETVAAGVPTPRRDGWPVARSDRARGHTAFASSTIARLAPGGPLSCAPCSSS